MIPNNCFFVLLFHHLLFVISIGNLSDISTALPRQDHNIEVVGKLCEREQPYVFCSSTQSSMLNTPSEGPALLHVLH
jgi:hypothetical protein